MFRRILNVEGYYTWSFLFWFGEVGCVLGFLYTPLLLQFDLDLMKEFPLFFLLLPIILFYSTWPNFSRLVRSKKWLWFSRSTTFYLIMSIGLSFQNFVDYEKINRNYLNRSIHHVFNLNVPESRSHHIINRRSNIIDIYVVKDTIESAHPVIFIENIDDQVSLEEIQKVIQPENENFIDYFSLIANLHIDKGILMKHVNDVVQELRKANFDAINYSTGVQNSRYPPEYPVFKNFGILRTLYPYSSALEDFLDSAENIDLKGKKIRFSKTSSNRIVDLRSLNRIKVYVTSDSMTLNGQLIESERMADVVQGFIRKYSPRYAIIFDYDENISFGRYIQVLDLIRMQVDRLRQQLSIEMLGKPYELNNFWYDKSEFDTIRSYYPMNIMEWTKEEK